MLSFLEIKYINLTGNWGLRGGWKEDGIGGAGRLFQHKQHDRDLECRWDTGANHIRAKDTITHASCIRAELRN